MPLRAHQEKKMPRSATQRKDIEQRCSAHTFNKNVFCKFTSLVAGSPSSPTFGGPCVTHSKAIFPHVAQQYWCGRVLCWIAQLFAAEPCVPVRHSRILTRGTLHKWKAVLHQCKTCSELWDQTHHLCFLLHQAVSFFLSF